MVNDFTDSPDPGFDSRSKPQGNATVEVVSTKLLHPNFITLSPNLGASMDFDAIFSLVKGSVKATTGKERVGIGLALADLPSILGAFWEVGGNYIVLNENLVRAFKFLEKPDLDYNSFVFVTLMHEYLHSLGFIDESIAREMTTEICSKLFGTDHPAYALGHRDPWEVYPFLRNVPRSGSADIKFVSKFDSESTSYIA